MVSAALKNMQRTYNIAIYVSVGIIYRVANPCLRTQMYYLIEPFIIKKFLDRFPVSEVYTSYIKTIIAGQY